MEFGLILAIIQMGMSAQAAGRASSNADRQARAARDAAIQQQQLDMELARQNADMQRTIAAEQLQFQQQGAMAQATAQFQQQQLALEQTQQQRMANAELELRQDAEQANVARRQALTTALGQRRQRLGRTRPTVLTAQRQQIGGSTPSEVTF